MSERHIQAIRLQVQSIGEVAAKLSQYAQLFDLPMHRVQASIKGEMTAFEDGRWCDPIDVRTFRQVEDFGHIGGVANRRAKIKVDGEKTWVALKFSDGPIDLLLQEA